MAPSDLQPQALHNLIEEDSSDGLDADRSVGPRGSRRRAAVAAVSGVLLLAAAAAKLTWQPRAPASVIDDNAALSLAETKPKLLPRPLECSLATTQDCSASQCCQNFGYQCFAKNATWAACLKKCDGGKLQRDGNGTWTCKKLGDPNRCATASEDCRSFGCCADVGHQCYTKNANWGSCRKTCSPPDSCDPIGPRNTMDYRNDYIEGMVEVEPWVKNCSHIGDNCASTKCCSFSGYRCYEKNATWASCLQKCFPGKWNGGFPERPLVQNGTPKANPPPHWNATFSLAPPGPWTCKRLSVPMKPGTLVGTSLYCFTVVVTDDGSGKPNHALDILKAAQKAYTHIFACDHWTVYSDKDMQLSPGRTVNVYSPHVERRPNTKHWVNLPVFLTVWKIIRQSTTWKSFPWIVKSDPTAIFIPGRLRRILKYQHVTDNGIFLENCKGTRMSFHGSLEVMSVKAFGTFLDHIEDCQRVLPWNNGSRTHFRYYGEDKFLEWCMHTSGVDKVPSIQQFETVPKEQSVLGLHITRSCPGHKDLFERTASSYLPNCSRIKTAGLHAFSTVDEYMQCLRKTAPPGSL